jgi:hypothetical protein
VTVIDDEEPPDGQALLERPPRIHDRSDSFLPGDSTDDEFWLDDVSWTENSITNPTSVSTPVTDISIVDNPFGRFRCVEPHSQ